MFRTLKTTARLTASVIVTCAITTTSLTMAAPEQSQSGEVQKLAPMPRGFQKKPPTSKKDQRVALRLVNKGTRLFVEANPTPRELEYFSQSRRLGKQSGKGKTLFDISRYVDRATDSKIRIVATSMAGQRYEQTFDVRRYQSADRGPTQAERSRTRTERDVTGGTSQATDDRMRPGLIDEVRTPRQSSGTRHSGSRQSSTSTLRQPDSNALYLDRIPPAVKSAAARPSGASGARLTEISPDPAVVGRELALRGENLGRDGDVYLEVAGLRLLPPVVRWGEREVVVTLPSEMARTIGDHQQRARVWLYTEGSGATMRLRIQPDASSLLPVISSAPVGVRPAQDIRIEGDYFLDREGQVELACPGLGRTFRGAIKRWSNTAITVNPAGRFSGAIRSSDCELVVRNHRGQEARRPARLEVHLVRETLPISRYWNFFADAPMLEMGRGGPLINGWVVVSARFSIDPDGGHRFEWTRPPVSGSADHRVQIQGRPRRNQVDPWDQRRRVVVTYTLEGPEGAPFLD